MGRGQEKSRATQFFSRPRYKHLASSRLLSSSAHDQRQPETKDRSTEDGATHGKGWSPGEDGALKKK